MLKIFLKLIINQLALETADKVFEAVQKKKGLSQACTALNSLESEIASEFF